MSFIEPGKFQSSVKLLCGRFEVRGDDAGNFDELASPGGHIHFEMMDAGKLFVSLEPRMASGLSTRTSQRLTLWITAKKGRLEVVVSDDE